VNVQVCIGIHKRAAEMNGWMGVWRVYAGRQIKE